MTPASGEPFGSPRGEVLERHDRGHRSGESAAKARTEAPAPATGARPTDGRFVLRALRHHWFLVLTVGALTAGSAAATAWFCFPSKYTTYSLLRVSEATPAVLPTAGSGFSSNAFVIYLKTQTSLLHSNKVLTAALGDPAVAQLPTVRRQEDPIHWLEEELKIESQGDSMIVKVGLAGDNPNEITQIVNAVIDAYMREVIQKEVIQKKEELTDLENRKARLQASYELNAKDFDQRLSGSGLLPVSPTTNGQSPAERMAWGEYTSKTQSLTHVRDEKAKLEMMLQTLRNQPQPTDQAILLMPGSPDVPSDPNGKVGDRLRDKEFEARLARARMMLEHKIQMVPNPQTHPEVITFRAGVEQMVKDHEAKVAAARQEFLIRVRAQLKATAEAEAVKLQPQLTFLTQREAELAAEVKKLAERLGQGGPDGKAQIPVDIKVLESDLEKQKKVLDDLSIRTQVLKVEVDSPPRVTLVQKATVPIQKEMKKQIGLTVASGLVGFVLIALCVTLYEMTVGRVFGPSDLETVVRAPILAKLPAPPRRGRGARPNPGEADRFTDSVDALRTVLQKRLLTRHGQSLLIASAAASEGKSTVALHLALSLAQTSRRVLLIDADFRTPKLHTWVDAAPTPGLGEALVNERKLSEVLTRTAVPGLWFMPAGTWSAKIRQCLSQGQLRTMLSRLKEDYDYVVIDSHAALETLDTPLLAQHTDAVLFTVQKHGSRLALVRQALQRLAEVGARKVGLVLVGEG